jgi:tetratricopeptide (TPR) repeat protein
MGQNAEAKACLLRAFHEYGFVPSGIILASHAIDNGEIRFARELLGRIEALDGPSQEWVNLSLAVCEATGEHPEQFLRGYLEYHPYALPPLRTLSNLLLQQNRPLEAEPILEELERLGCAQSALNLGVLCNRRGQFPEAIEHMKRCRALDPTNSAAAEQIEILTRFLEEAKAS